MDPDYLGTLLEVLLLTAMEHGWAGDHAIPAREAAEALEGSGYDPRWVRFKRGLACVGLWACRGWWG